MVNIAAAIFFIPWLLFNGEYVETSQMDLWLWGCLLAFIPGIMGHAVYNYSMSKLDPIDVGVGTLGEPVLGTILAFFIFDESLSSLQLLAILNLLLAILFSIEFKSSKTHESNSIQPQLDVI
jgi:drug/metabolite transporter (DMT)-like permease